MTAKTIRTTAEHTPLEEAIKASVKTYLASIAFAGTDVSDQELTMRFWETVGILDIENLQVNGGIAKYFGSGEKCSDSGNGGVYLCVMIKS